MPDTINIARHLICVHKQVSPSMYASYTGQSVSNSLPAAPMRAHPWSVEPRYTGNVERDNAFLTHSVGGLDVSGFFDAEFNACIQAVSRVYKRIDHMNPVPDFRVHINDMLSRWVYVYRRFKDPETCIGYLQYDNDRDRYAIMAYNTKLLRCVGEECVDPAYVSDPYENKHGVQILAASNEEAEMHEKIIKFTLSNVDVIPGNSHPTHIDAGRYCMRSLHHYMPHMQLRTMEKMEAKIKANECV